MGLISEAMTVFYLTLFLCFFEHRWQSEETLTLCPKHCWRAPSVYRPPHPMGPSATALSIFAALDTQQFQGHSEPTVKGVDHKNLRPNLGPEYCRVSTVRLPNIQPLAITLLHLRPWHTKATVGRRSILGLHMLIGVGRHHRWQQPIRWIGCSVWKW